MHGLINSRLYEASARTLVVLDADGWKYISLMSTSHTAEVKNTHKTLAQLTVQIIHCVHHTHSGHPPPIHISKYISLMPRTHTAAVKNTYRP